MMGITHLSGLEVAGVPTMGISGAPFFTGNWWFVDPLNGSDGGTGAADSPFSTIYRAYASAAADNNDVIVLVGSGDTSGTARLSASLAQSIDPTAMTGTVTWAKNALHLIGMTAPTAVNKRARFAPPTGTYTAATFGNSGNFFNVTATGCYFGNFSLFNGFSTGAASSQIAWIEAGGQNFYNNVDFGGMGDAASAGSTSSASLSIAGSGENTFVDCTFGLDTVQRTAANATIVFSGATPRNTFVRPRFLSWLSSGGTGAVHIKIGAAGIDRWVSLEDAIFLNAVQSSGSAMSDACSVTTPGGLVLLTSPSGAGITAWDSGSGFVYVTGPVPTFATTGIGAT